MKIEVKEAYEQIDVIRQLFLEYSNNLQIDLNFQSFQEEFAALPGKYSHPKGRLYFIVVDGEAGGCVGLRPFEACMGEMKRLYIRPKFQGMGLGRKLAEQIIMDARKIGYETLLLDTLPTMHSAIALYEKLGFTDTLAYYNNPIEGTRYFKLSLLK